MFSIGEIYCLTSPSGKKYIGQCVKYLSSGKKWGYISRWKEHIRDSKTKNYCRLLNNAIVKYGEENFKVELITECNILEMNQLEKPDIDWLVPHQANIRILEATAKKLNMSMDRVVVTIDRHGNTSAASIPLALDTAIREHKIKRGETLLMEAFGGGFTWGSALIKY